MIDSIGVYDKNTKSGKIKNRGKAGGDGGKAKTISLSPNDCINGALVKYNNHVLTEIRFYFKNGRKSEVVKASKTPNGSKRVSFGNKCLVGFHGRDGTLIDSLGFIIQEQSTDISMKNTYGWWEPIQTGRSLSPKVTIKSTSSTGF